MMAIGALWFGGWYFDVNDEVDDVLARFDDPLMRRACGQMDDIASFDMAAVTVANTRAADLVRFWKLWFDDFAAIDQRCLTTLHDHDVGSCLVDFSDAARIVDCNREAVIAEVVLVLDAERRDPVRPDNDVGFRSRDLRLEGCEQEK
jgi:hypothetical protein